MKKKHLKRPGLRPLIPVGTFYFSLARCFGCMPAAARTAFCRSRWDRRCALHFAEAVRCHPRLCRYRPGEAPELCGAPGATRARGALGATMCSGGVQTVSQGGTSVI